MTIILGIETSCDETAAAVVSINHAAVTASDRTKSGSRIKSGTDS